MIPLIAGAAVLVVVWAAVVAPVWVRSARTAGGHWALSGIVWLSGPVNSMIQLLYPNGQNPTGLGLLAARAATTAAWTLGVVALVTAVRRPRPGQTFLIVGLLLFSASLVVSALFGYRPSVIPEEYWITPLLLLPFLLDGGFSWQWLTGVLRRALRAIVVLSLVITPLLPAVAFDQEGGREIFGIERVQGITGHPNTLGILAVFAVIMELRGGRLLWLVPELVAMLLAQSTTAWVALALGLLVLAGRLGVGARVLAITIGALALIVALNDPNFVSDYIPPSFFTLTGRTTIWQAALAGFFLDPVLGYGPLLLDAQYRATYLGVFDAAAQAHNQVIQTLGETGLVGLACLVVLLAGILRSGWRANAATGGLSVALVLAFAARLVSETPLKPQGSTALLLIVIAVLGIPAAGTAIRERREFAPVTTRDRPFGSVPPPVPAALVRERHA